MTEALGLLGAAIVILLRHNNGRLKKIEMEKKQRHRVCDKI